jgi:hypothetical protein
LNENSKLEGKEILRRDYLRRKVIKNRTFVVVGVIFSLIDCEAVGGGEGGGGVERKGLKSEIERKIISQKITQQKSTSSLKMFFLKNFFFIVNFTPKGGRGRERENVFDILNSYRQTCE